MNPMYYNLEGSKFKSIALIDADLYISQKQFSSIEKVKASGEKSGLMASTKVVPINEVRSFVLNEKKSTVSLTYRNDKLKEKTIEAEFDSEQAAADFCERLNQVLGLQVEEKDENRFKAMLPNLVIGGVLIVLAVTVPEGDAIETEGGRSKGRIIKMLLRWMVENLGQYATIGILAGIGFVFFVLAFRRYRNPAVEKHYS